MGFLQPHGRHRGRDEQIAVTEDLAAEHTMIVRWLALALLAGMMSGLLYLFLRSGVKIKPDVDRKTDDWPTTTLGGSGS